MKKAAVVIPTYKKELSELEKISLAQAEKIFEKHDRLFVMPYSLDAPYIAGGMGEIRFEDSRFESIQAYNELLMDERFYKKFTGYEYILIYQLDAFVFEDRLEHFCGLGYDYIGAPWLAGAQHVLDGKTYIMRVGNGGFSLRNVKKCMGLIRKKRHLFSGKINEDQFFALGGLDGFKVAPIETALEFAIEREVKKCIEMNGNRLPFGCHAWEKHDLKFWKQYIEAHGYKVDDKYLSGGDMDSAFAETLDMEREIAFFWESIYEKRDPKEFLINRKKVYIWGAGEKGRILGKWLRGAGAEIEGYLDGNAELSGTCIEGYKVLPMEALEENAEDAYIIVAADRCRNEIAERLEEMGYRYRQGYVFYNDAFRTAAGDCVLDMG